MNRIIWTKFVALIVLSHVAFAAQQFGTAQEAKAMLDRAVVALKSNEPRALSEFNDPKNKQFRDRDLYVFCYNISDGNITAYSSPALLNTDIRTLAYNDDPVGQRAYEATKNALEGSVTTIDYNFPKPGTTEPATKQIVQTRIGNQGCGVTYYQ